MLARYLDGGGNHVLTSETSERLVGKYLRSSVRRGEIMLATGASEPRPSAADGDARGTRARISGAVEASLRRLGVERVDLCWARAWDGRTPAEEVVSIAEDLVRAGKIRSLGLADVPAWYLARVKTLAERSDDLVQGLLLPYSLRQRVVEFELLPSALALDVGVCGTGALARGFLTGKYRRDHAHAPGARTLLQRIKEDSPLEARARDGGWTLVDLLVETAAALGRTPAQVALNWAATRPGVVTTRVHATSLEQLDEDLAALDFRIPWLFDDRLERASRPALLYPYDGFSWDQVRSSLGRPGK
ncbi:MAG: aldo/keto reductase [Myxococcales bacterium]|nr:aldo/keto reductase [Myxococcales bacterium]